MNRFEERKRKSFGQHFLVDSSVIDRILSATLDLSTELKLPNILEIGPGRGALTSPLLRRLSAHHHLTVVEKDRELAKAWIETKDEKLNAHCGDFLEVEQKDWNPSALPTLVLSNLPYSAGTAILLRLTEYRDNIPAMVLMFQREVAQRLLAPPRDRNRGSLSLFIQNLWNVESLIRVSAKSFSPPPKVESEVLLLRRRDQPKIPETALNLDHWNQLLRTCFRHPRKMIRANLREHPLGEEILEQISFSNTLRAQHLSWENWRELVLAFRNLNSKV